MKLVFIFQITTGGCTVVYQVGDPYDKVTGGPAQWKQAMEDQAYSWNHRAFYGGKAARFLEGDLRVGEGYIGAK